jgi:DeoR family transcriptional regulator of aga operon/DeoR family fructose operon transcriptional repressor
LSTRERRALILKHLEMRGEVGVDALASEFSVSHVTVRKDLAELEGRGLLHRTHGGAQWAHRSLFNPSFVEKSQLQLLEKRAIARAALSLVEEGDSIILDAGSTTLEFAKLLKSSFRRLHVFTNAVPVALELAGSGFEIVLLGGTLREHSMALIGPATVRALAPYHVDKVFLSATGASQTHGLTTPNDLEAEVKRAMVRAAGVAHALVDSSKVGRATLASFAGLNELQTLVTDAGAGDPLLEEFQGVRVIVATLEPH